MELSDFIKILFGTGIGLITGWFQSWLRRDEENRKIHREKLELLFSDVNVWKSSTSLMSMKANLSNSIAIDFEKIEESLGDPDFSRIELLINFYAPHLRVHYDKCLSSWSELSTYAVLRDIEKLRSTYNNFNRNTDDLKKGILKESSKYNTQSISYRIKKAFRNKK